MVICSEDEGTSSEVLACDMMSKAMDTEVLCDRLQRVFRLDNEFQSGEYRLIGCCGNLVDNRHSMPLWEIFMIMVESKGWCTCDFWWEHNRKIRLPDHIVTFAFLLQIFAHFCDKILCNFVRFIYTHISLYLWWARLAPREEIKHNEVVSRWAGETWVEPF